VVLPKVDDRCCCDSDEAELLHAVVPDTRRSRAQAGSATSFEPTHQMVQSAAGRFLLASLVRVCLRSRSNLKTSSAFSLEPSLRTQCVSAQGGARMAERVHASALA